MKFSSVSKTAHLKLRFSKFTKLINNSKNTQSWATLILSFASSLFCVVCRFLHFFFFAFVIDNFDAAMHWMPMAYYCHWNFDCHWNLLARNSLCVRALLWCYGLVHRRLLSFQFMLCPCACACARMLDCAHVHFVFVGLQLFWCTGCLVVVLLHLHHNNRSISSLTRTLIVVPIPNVHIWFGILILVQLSQFILLFGSLGFSFACLCIYYAIVLFRPPIIPLANLLHYSWAHTFPFLARPSKYREFVSCPVYAFCMQSSYVCASH